MLLVTRKHQGTTLIEVVLVVVIIAILATLFLANYLAQLRRAEDGQRRRDLHELQRAMEDYYNDYGCYPQGADLEKLSHCGSKDFRPWLDIVPCDPRSHQPYQILVEQSECPSWFSIYADLAYPRSEDSCSQGCQINGQTYHYGVSSSNITPPASFGSGGGATPSPGPTGTITVTPTPTPPSGCYKPTCGGSDGNPSYCLPNTCSTCCPGVKYRCNSAGTLCCYDNSCQLKWKKVLPWWNY